MTRPNRTGYRFPSRASWLALATLMIVAMAPPASARSSQSFWHIETVDALGDSGWYTSIALDGAGRPHISAGRLSDHVIRYTYRDAAGWHPETVDAFDGASTSLVLDAQDWPRLAYRSGGLRFAAKDASGWHIETVDATPGAGMTASLTLDGEGDPHIAYTDDTQLAYAVLDSTGWHTETIDALGGQSVSLKLDSTGTPHVGYQRDGMRYATKGATGWELSLIEAGTPVTGGGASLVLDAADRAHVSYDSWPEMIPCTCGGLNQASWNGATWVTRPIDACAGAGSLAKDRNDGLRVSYRYMVVEPPPPAPQCAVPGRGPYSRTSVLWEISLRYGIATAGGWFVETIESADAGSCLGTNSSLAVDWIGVPHIAYAGANCELKFAYRETMTPVELTTVRAASYRGPQPSGPWRYLGVGAVLAGLAIFARHARQFRKVQRPLAA